MRATRKAPPSSKHRSGLVPQHLAPTNIRNTSKYTGDGKLKDADLNKKFTINFTVNIWALILFLALLTMLFGALT